MTSQMIESIIMTVFGVIITAASIATNAGTNLITLGGLLTACGIC